MKHVLLAAALALVATTLAAATQCERSPRIVEKCFWAHGRYSLWNGTPTDRIWLIGTHRIFGVYGPEDVEFSLYPLPSNIAAATAKTPDPFSFNLYGDYRLCPFTKARKGWMQYGCVGEAKHLIVKPR